MIKIVIYKAKEGRIKGFKISGHSGYGIRGTDIVCSAVSALGQTAILGLLKVGRLKWTIELTRDILHAVLPMPNPTKAYYVRSDT